jgi:hypothetical protein
MLILCGTAVYGCAQAPIILNQWISLHKLGHNFPVQYVSFGLILINVASWTYLLVRMNPYSDYCELQEAGLLLHRDRKDVLIPYTSLERILPTTSLNELFVWPEGGNIIRISVGEKKRFLAELSKRCPQLAQTNTALGLMFERAIL